MRKAVKLQVGVKILLINKEGKVLLLQRSLKKYPDIAGRWDLVGGRINPGQSLLMNLKREVREETGLVLKRQPQLVFTQDILRAKGRHVVRLTYLGKGSGQVNLDPDEHESFNWFTLRQLRNLKDLDIYAKEMLKSGAVDQYLPPTEKLVRDNIPAILRKKKVDFAYYVAGRKEYRERLFEKLGEELIELYAGRNAEEMADMMETLLALARELGVTGSQLTKAQKQKLRDKGGFRKRIILTKW